MGLFNDDERVLFLLRVILLHKPLIAEQDHNNSPKPRRTRTCPEPKPKCIRTVPTHTIICIYPPPLSSSYRSQGKEVKGTYRESTEGVIKKAPLGVIRSCSTKYEDFCATVQEIITNLLYFEKAGREANQSINPHSLTITTRFCFILSKLIN